MVELRNADQTKKIGTRLVVLGHPCGGKTSQEA